MLGTLAIARPGCPGARPARPSMVLLRGLFGARLSYVPTVLNVLQCIGWGTFEIVTIANAAHTMRRRCRRRVYVLIAGAITAR